jgi:hypothetical protein
VNDTIRGFGTKNSRVINESDGRAAQSIGHPASMITKPRNRPGFVEIGDMEEFDMDTATIPGALKPALGMSVSNAVTEKSRTQLK